MLFGGPRDVNSEERRVKRWREHNNGNVGAILGREGGVGVSGAECAALSKE